MIPIANNHNLYILSPDRLSGKMSRISRYSANGMLASVIGLVALIPIVASGVAIAGYLSGYHLAILNLSSLGAMVVLGMGMLYNEHSLEPGILSIKLAGLILLSGFIVANSLAIAGKFDTETLGYLIAGTPLGWGFLACTIGMGYLTYGYFDMVSIDKKIVANHHAASSNQHVPYPNIRE